MPLTELDQQLISRLILRCKENELALQALAELQNKQSQFTTGIAEKLSALTVSLARLTQLLTACNPASDSPQKTWHGTDTRP